MTKIEAKDTVMMPQATKAKRKELFPHGHKDCFECEQFVREAQAEITWPIAFKAGYNEALKDKGVSDKCEWDNGYIAGIRKVVETYRRENPSAYKKHEVYWSRKEKEWGIVWKS